MNSPWGIKLNPIRNSLLGFGTGTEDHSQSLGSPHSSCIQWERLYVLVCFPGQNNNKSRVCAREAESKHQAQTVVTNRTGHKTRTDYWDSERETSRTWEGETPEQQQGSEEESEQGKCKQHRILARMQRISKKNRVEAKPKSVSHPYVLRVLIQPLFRKNLKILSRLHSETYQCW